MMGAAAIESKRQRAMSGFVRLLLSLVYLHAVEAATDESSLQTTASEVSTAIATAQRTYEHLRQDYFQHNCTELWGDFPSPDSLLAPPKMVYTLSGGIPCSCGMLYDLAKSRLKYLQEQQQSSSNHNLEISQQQQQQQVLATTASQAQQSTFATCNPDTGKAANLYPCKNVGLVAHLPLSRFLIPGTEFPPEQCNDIWGWTHKSSKREFLIWGVKEGHFFFEVKVDSEEQPLVLLGFLPSSNGESSMWHDAKVVGHFVYMGSEIGDHGIQILNLNQLLEIDTFKVLQWDKTYRGPGPVSKRIGATHNIVANSDSRYVYGVGGGDSVCQGGLYVLDVWDAGNPRFAACWDGDGYIHDAQCVNYEGPDGRYAGKEICVCFNADSVTIIDVTKKNNINIISKASYPGTGYTHQGWLSTNQEYVVFGDEVDEMSDPPISRTRTLVLDVKNLKQPKFVGAFSGRTPAVDHNQYVGQVSFGDGQQTDLVFQANYEAGLSIQQPLDYETVNFTEVGYFDTYPDSDNPSFNGAWSVYPLYYQQNKITLKNNEVYIAISSQFDGLFLVKTQNLKEVVGFSASDAPTDAPVAPPNDTSDAPTDVPVAPPQTPSPTASPDICEDTPANTKFDYVSNGREQNQRSCRFIRNTLRDSDKPNRRRSVLCEEEATLQDQTKQKIWSLCPRACQICPDQCKDKRQKFTIGDKPKTRNCGYLEKRRKGLRRELCDSRVRQVKSGRRALLSNICEVSCGKVGVGRCSPLLEEDSIAA